MNQTSRGLFTPLVTFLYHIHTSQISTNFSEPKRQYTRPFGVGAYNLQSMNVLRSKRVWFTRLCMSVLTYHLYILQDLCLAAKVNLFLLVTLEVLSVVSSKGCS